MNTAQQEFTSQLNLVLKTELHDGFKLKKNHFGEKHSVGITALKWLEYNSVVKNLFGRKRWRESKT